YHISELHEEAKGLREVLRERGLWPEKGLKLKEAQELMSQQSDFLAQKRQLEEIIVAAGHQIVFYSKFHCKLNYIENFWSAAKRYSQLHCDYSYKGLQRTVLLYLNSVSLLTIRQYARKAFHYMDAY
ncbi:12928_t:CDS:1, partial [Cetraspora pellucida]